MQHVFRPIVDLHTRQPIGFEALARPTDGRSPLEVLAEAAARGPEALRDPSSAGVGTGKGVRSLGRKG